MNIQQSAQTIQGQTKLAQTALPSHSAMAVKANPVLGWASKWTGNHLR